MVTCADGNLNELTDVWCIWPVVWVMVDRDLNNRKPKSILTLIVSFTLLGVLVVGAVLFGNLHGDRADVCRPLGSASGNDDGATLIVWSDEYDELMLCDVGQETVKYVAPERDASMGLIGKGMIRLDTGDEVVLPDSLMEKVEEYDGGQSDHSVFLYKKGEFGEVEDCYGEPDDVGDGNEIWSADPFGVYSDPDTIEACWVEIEILDDLK